MTALAVCYVNRRVDAVMDPLVQMLPAKISPISALLDCLDYSGNAVLPQYWSCKYLIATRSRLTGGAIAMTKELKTVFMLRNAVSEILRRSDTFIAFTVSNYLFQVAVN